MVFLFHLKSALIPVLITQFVIHYALLVPQLVLPLV